MSSYLSEESQGKASAEEYLTIPWVGGSFVSLTAKGLATIVASHKRLREHEAGPETGERSPSPDVQGKRQRDRTPSIGPNGADAEGENLTTRDYSVCLPESPSKEASHSSSGEEGSEHLYSSSGDDSCDDQTIIIPPSEDDNRDDQTIIITASMLERYAIEEEAARQIAEKEAEILQARKEYTLAWLETLQT